MNLKKRIESNLASAAGKAPPQAPRISKRELKERDLKRKFLGHFTYRISKRELKVGDFWGFWGLNCPRLRISKRELKVFAHSLTPASRISCSLNLKKRIESKVGDVIFDGGIGPHRISKRELKDITADAVEKLAKKYDLNLKKRIESDFIRLEMDNSALSPRISKRELKVTAKTRKVRLVPLTRESQKEN